MKKRRADVRLMEEMHASARAGAWVRSKAGDIHD